MNPIADLAAIPLALVQAAVYGVIVINAVGVIALLVGSRRLRP